MKRVRSELAGIGPSLNVLGVRKQKQLWQEIIFIGEQHRNEEILDRKVDYCFNLFMVCKKIPCLSLYVTYIL